jgi:hypothetical protein
MAYLLPTDELNSIRLCHEKSDTANLGICVEVGASRIESLESVTFFESLCV